MYETIRYNPQVFDDLQAIKEYISADNISAGVNVVKEILQAIDNLKEFPETGARLQPRVKQKTRYRFLVVYSYCVLYYIEKDFVVISTVYHAAKDITVLKLHNSR